MNFIIKNVNNKKLSEKEMKKLRACLVLNSTCYE